VNLDTIAIKALRGLALDMPRAADSGHSGTALACAPVGWLLYSRLLRHNPDCSSWPNRDRFVMSNGHACVLLYGLLHLCGYAVTLNDLRNFRKRAGRRTPGHPETWRTAGIDCSTGPLGQGLAMAVGMAIGERFLRTRFGPELIDYVTYVLCSDGDLMEGVTAEASSLAGHQKPGKLIVVYDDNSVTIDGPTGQSWSEDVSMRYRAYGWQVLEVECGEDLEKLEGALLEARADKRPTLIRMRTVIGYPSPGIQGRPEAHSPPLLRGRDPGHQAGDGIGSRPTLLYPSGAERRPRAHPQPRCRSGPRVAAAP
jgi:transketolase